MTRVVLADDHKILRQGLRFLLESDSDIEVIGEATSGKEAVDIVAEKRPDLLVADLRMPEMNGIELARRVTELYPETMTVILSMYNNRAYVDEALSAGARAYVLKDASYDELAIAVREVLSGNQYISPAILSKNST